MFKVGQEVIGRLATGLRSGESHPSVGVGEPYTVRKLMGDGRVIVHGIKWGVSPRRFSASPATSTD